MASRDYTNQEFGRLTARYRTRRTANYVYYWHCDCKCGNTAEVRADHLRTGNTTSCGCWQAESAGERNVKHGMHDTKEYKAWQGLKDRCRNPNNPSWDDYGGRGITVCNEWLGPDGFVNFYNHIGDAPGPGYSVDRYPNVNGNYEPGNVRWATAEEQNRNKTDNRIVEFNGKSQSLMDWAEETGINYGTLQGRLGLGWTVERALTEGVHPNRRLLTFHGQTRTLLEWAAEKHMHPNTLRSRLNYGWSLERALTQPVRWY